MYADFFCLTGNMNRGEKAEPHMGLVARKPTFRVCDQVTLKEICSAMVNRQVSLINWQIQCIPIIQFSISLKVTEILNTVSHIPGSKMDSIPYTWK